MKRSNLLQLGVGGNDIPKKAPLTLMKYKCFFAGYQKPAKLVKSFRTVFKISQPSNFLCVNFLDNGTFQWIQN